MRQQGRCSELLLYRKITDMWDVTTCTSVNRHQRFGGICYPHFQDKRTFIHIVRLVIGLLTCFPLTVM
jgi:hypothetical protein